MQAQVVQGGMRLNLTLRLVYCVWCHRAISTGFCWPSYRNRKVRKRWRCWANFKEALWKQAQSQNEHELWGRRFVQGGASEI